MAVKQDIFAIRDATTMAGEDEESGLKRSISATGLTAMGVGAIIGGVERLVPCDEGATATQTRMMENAPFYARTGIASTLNGQPLSGVNENLSLARVANPLVRLMLPFKMFRRAR